MRNLSKSKLMNYRQCEKRLWLEIHEPELRMDSAGTLASFEGGNQVGDIAQRIYDPKGQGTFVDRDQLGFDGSFQKTNELLTEKRPIFEAGFRIDGAMAFADILLPAKGGRWSMVEVKSSTSVKDYHRDDAAIQAYIARKSGLDLASIRLAYVDSTWTYPGGGDYRGLLAEADLTQESFGRDEEVEEWIAEAQAIANRRKEPLVQTGGHCRDPYECGFLEYCSAQQPQAEQPITWLPRRSASLNEHIEANGLIEMRDAPDELLNESQRRVKQATLTGQTWMNQGAAKLALGHHSLPAYFLDFESIQFAVPRWKGTRPYQQIVFQFSVHRLLPDRRLEHRSFLDLSGGDPSESLAQALLNACGESGPIFVYNQAFEKTRIGELADRFPTLRQGLLALNARIVDLLPIARDHFYHPSQQGSWSIKAVLPAMFPEDPTLNYKALEGVQDGGTAQSAYLEAIHPETSSERRAEIEMQLLKYCGLDTYATVKLWSRFTGNAIKD
jgi:CRISPR/Cas system-associated exonuclease Cas4 (RecB family)